MASSRQPPFMSPATIAATGQKIYDERFRADMEAHQRGRFVAVNVRTEEASVGDTPEQALEEGRLKDPVGLFHLVRVGHPSVYSGGAMTSHAGPSQDWIFGR
jgi:hypothetical protein